VCGIFAYNGTGPPDPGMLERAAIAAGRRGPHGHGWMTRDPDGGYSTVHRAGPIAVSAKDIRALGAHQILGHTRLASFGDWQDLTQLQPVLRGGHGVAHNGCIYNADTFAVSQATDTIAFAVAYAAARQVKSPLGALADLTAGAVQEAWAIVIADQDGHLYATRHYHPLWTWEHGNGTYLCSWPAGPAAAELPPGQIVTI